jgi:hypothetical protein
LKLQQPDTAKFNNLRRKWEARNTGKKQNNKKFPFDDFFLLLLGEYFSSPFL